MSAFAGQTALITGASQGIGLAIAARLAASGADIVTLDVNDTAGGDLERVVSGHGRSLEAVRGSVADPKAWQAALARTERLDMLVNNAGVSGYVGSLIDYPEADFDDVLAVNTKGVFLGMKLSVPLLLKSRGRIVNVSSIAGVRGGRNIIGYAASKHAVIGMTLSVASEFGAAGVRTNAVCPAPIQTDMIDRLARIRMPDDPEAFATQFRSGLPLGRYGEPDEVADAVVFLLSEQSSFINGAILPVDGGALAR